MIHVSTISAFLYFFFVSSIVYGQHVKDKTDSTNRQIKKTFLCLTMIVKNESRIIERCLNSVKDIVDCISICDTGSTDNTVELIEQFMKKNGIRGKVHRHVWRNFGYNRTLSAQAAQTTLEELGFSLPNTYLLLLDADMMLQVDQGYSPDHLFLDSYLVVQKSGVFSHHNIRLIRASLPWECIGVTHEYWACRQTNQPSIKLSSLMIDDRHDGGCKADKFERDIRLLTQGLKDEPDNTRYMFYCAESYQCLKQFEDAIRWYKNRIERGGWNEEVWFSKFMIGECYEEMGNWDNALHWYLEAYQFLPIRAEPLQRIAKHYRLNGHYDLAYLFAKQGQRIPYPQDQLLFVYDPVYEYQFDEELSVAAYYTQFREEGFAAANRLLLAKKVPQYIKEATYKNILFYVKNLKNAHLKPIPMDLRIIEAEQNIPEGEKNASVDLSHFRGSSALVKFDEGFLMLVHEIVDNEKPLYLHRFVSFDKNNNIQKISKPFTFLHQGFEHCGGLVVDQAGISCTLTIGKEDRKTFLCTVDFATIRSLLEPLATD